MGYNQMFFENETNVVTGGGKYEETCLRGFFLEIPE